MTPDPIDPNFVYDDEPTEPFGMDWWDPIVPMAILAAASLVGIVVLLVWALWGHKP